jgi:hypothetical protein
MRKIASAQADSPESKHKRLADVLLRVLGAALQVLATLELIRVLSPEDAGIYFRGFVIALGLSTLLRGKYEIYIARHIINKIALSTGIADGAMLSQLARRTLLRSSLLCAGLLVVTADLDIQAPQLQTMLQTYLPFVLSLPAVSLSSLLGEALRAANRTLGIVVATYAVNVSILLAVILAPRSAPLAVYSWAFLVGSAAAAAAAIGLARRVFPTPSDELAKPASREQLLAVDSLELFGFARGAQLWGPLCILSVYAAPLQMAQYAVAARLAMIIEFFIPALNLIGGDVVSESGGASRDIPGRLLKQLAASLFYSCAFVLPLFILAPATLKLFGEPYDSNWTIYLLRLGVQWLNGAGRPAVRFAAVAYDARRIGLVIGFAALAGVLVCLVGIGLYGAIAAAAGSLVASLILIIGAILMAFRGSAGKGRPPTTSLDTP